jgi:putative hydrolase of the HAD superfamily
MSKKHYKHLFFDLDRTLWDFDASSHHTFIDLFTHYRLTERNIPSVEEFLKVYNKFNEYYWDLYRKGLMEKAVLRGIRFGETLKTFGVDDPVLAEEISEDYLYRSPRNVFLFPNTIETLDYLYGRTDIHLITNGFEEVQTIKLDASGLRPYFTSIVTSEEAGVKKPDPAIFEFALQRAGALASESLMVGDDLEVDIIGAANVGMDQVFFNPERIEHAALPTIEIFDLKELTAYF